MDMVTLVLLGTGALLVLIFLHVPLALIILYAFSSEDKSYVFPPPGLTTQWFGVAWERTAARIGARVPEHVRSTQVHHAQSR